MAKKSQTLELIIKARDSASKTVNTVFKSMKANIKSLKSAVFNLKTGLAALVTALGLRSFVTAANTQAKAVAGLDTAIKSMNRDTPELSKKLQDLAAALQKTTNYGDEATIQGQKFLLTYKDITDDLLPETTKTMLDLAALMGGDTVQAANMLGKASMGMTGELRRAGITVDTQTYKLYGYKGVLKEIQAQVAGQAEVVRKATGPWEALGNYIGDFKEQAGFLIRDVADAIGEDLIDALDIGIKQMKEFRESADFKDWAKDVREKIIETFENILLGTARLYDNLAPILKDIKREVGSVIDFWKDLPTWVQEIGIIGAILGGKKGAGLILGYSWVLDLASNTGKVIRAMRDELITWEEWVKMSVEERKAFVKMLDESAGFNEAGGQIIRRAIKDTNEDLTGALADAETWEQRVKIFISELRKRRAEREKAAKTPAIGAGATAGEATVDLAMKEANAKAYVERLKAITKTALVRLEALYKDGQIKLEEYFAERKNEITAQYEAEIKLAEDAARKETDAAEKVGLETKVIELREEYNRKIIELETEKQDAIKKLDEEELERRQIIEAAKLRIIKDAAGTLKADFASELAELDNKHQEEIQKLRDLNATKEELDEAYRQHKLEKDQLLVDQERRLYEARMEMAMNCASGLESIFSDLYDLSGGKIKEFFYLAKAAAIAEATINTSQAVTKALAQGGYMGIAQAVIVAAKGAVEIAKISSQSLAKGGPVLGVSPSEKADDKVIRATSGEFMQPVPAVKYYGVRVMEAIRTLAIPREIFRGISLPQIKQSRPAFTFAAGGQVPAGGAGSYSVTVPVNVTGVSNPEKLARILPGEIEATVIRVVREIIR